MAMEDHFKDLEIEPSSLHTTSAGSSGEHGSPQFPLKLHNLVCSPVVLIFFIERHFVIKNIKLFYYVFPLRKRMPYFLCSCSALFFWFVLIKSDMNILGIRIITITFATIVMYKFISMFRILFLKKLDCFFHENNFFADIQDLISNEYFLQTLVGFVRESKDSDDSIMRAQLNWIKKAFSNMLRLLCTRLHTMCTEVETKHEAEHIISLVFKNLTNNEPRDINEADLLLVMKTKNVAKFLQLFDGAAETKIITQESLKNWVTQICNNREHIVQLLNSTTRGTEQLKIYVLAAQIYLAALFWFRFMRIMRIVYPMHLSPSQLIFIITMFSGRVVYAIVTHWFDVGDSIAIDNEQFVVEHIQRFFSIVLKKENNEFVRFPISSLLTKSISNLSRSSDLIEKFEILVSTTTNSAHEIAALKLKIDELIGSEPENWGAECRFDMKAVNVNDGKDSYDLEITNVRKFENYKVKKKQRSEFILKLEMLMEDLGFINFTIK